MLETLRQVPFFLNRHREAPLLKQREMFLRHLEQQGTTRSSLLSISNELLHIVRLLRLDTMRDVSLDEIRRAAERFVLEEQSNPRARSYGHTASFSMYAAKKWLRFHGDSLAKSIEGPKIPASYRSGQMCRRRWTSISGRLGEAEALYGKSGRSRRRVWQEGQFR